MAKSDKNIFDEVAESFARREDPETIALEDARYDAETLSLVLAFADGSRFTLPIRSLAALAHAADDEVSDVKVIGGDVLHFEKLDAFYEVPALMAQRVGINALMAHLAAEPGRSRRRPRPLQHVPTEQRADGRARRRQLRPSCQRSSRTCYEPHTVR